MESSQLKSKSEEEIPIGVYVCHCGLNIGGSVDCEEVAKFAATLPHVVLAKDNRYTCSDQGQELIKKRYSRAQAQPRCCCFMHS